MMRTFEFVFVKWRVWNRGMIGSDLSFKCVPLASEWRIDGEKAIVDKTMRRLLLVSQQDMIVVWTAKVLQGKEKRDIILDIF